MRWICVDWKIVFYLMARGITTNIDQELNYLSNTFERQSNLTETYRTNLLRVACRFMSSDWVHGESLLQEIHESRLRERCRKYFGSNWPGISRCFPKATQHLIGSGPLLDIIQRVHNFEQKAPEIRKILKTPEYGHSIYQLSKLPYAPWVKCRSKSATISSRPLIGNLKQHETFSFTYWLNRGSFERRNWRGLLA